MTGFNRRFSPAAEALRDRLATRQAPMMIDYRVNAGHIPADHWVHGPEGGGRNRGEACHFYDFFLSMTQAEVHTVNAVALRPGTGHYQRSDNFSAQIGFTDGSVASLTYTALGDRAEPKERIEVFCDGRIFHIEDFRSFTASDQKGNLSSARIQKGHEEELLAFADAIRLGSAWPIPLAQQIAATRIALAVEAAIGN
jgi:predicted dehydrogenase